MALDIKKLSILLSYHGSTRDDELIKKSLAQVVTLDNLGYDVTSLLPSIVKFIPSHDMLIKKLSCSLLSRFSKKIPDLCLLVQNTLNQDCLDANPFVRSLAIKTLCSLDQPVDSLPQVLEKALNDPSAHVRRVAVLCCARLHANPDSAFSSSNFTSLLYKMLRDPDPTVVFNVLVCLDEILVNEGGATITRNISYIILNKLQSFTDLNMAHALTILRRYVPQTPQEVFDILNLLDSFLNSKSVSVLVSATKLFLYFLKDEPGLRRDVVARVLPNLTDLLSYSGQEIQLGILEFVEGYLVPEYVNVILKLYRVFFCKECDTTAVKMIKISILARLIDDYNRDIVLDELGVYSTDCSAVVSKTAVRELGLIVECSRDSPRKKCLEKLLELLTVDCGFVVSNVLTVIQRMECLCLGDLGIVWPGDRLLDSYRLKLTESGKCALFHLVGTLGKDLKGIPGFLETVVHEDLKREGSVAVKQCIVTCCVKMFIRRPAEFQEILGEVMEKCWDDDELLCDQAELYYNCLEKGVKFAEQVICN